VDQLEQRDAVVGRLVVGWEHGPFVRARDERVLAELARPLGLAVGWVRLATELRRSSVAIVTAREEERRRLRRDMHDGLGPALTGVSLGLRTAVRQLARAPDAAALAPSRILLERVADEVDAVVAEVKRIVRDLRPTALDQLGLFVAVTEFTRTFADDLEFHLTIPDPPVALPAAVEVAVYRIVTEAVTNVIRHSTASRAVVTLTAEETALRLEVRDNGVNAEDSWEPGVGLTSIRERTAELGGVCEIRYDRTGGQVRVYLPLPSAARPSAETPRTAGLRTGATS
jgi:signal transduction histidine kinase